MNHHTLLDQRPVLIRDVEELAEAIKKFQKEVLNIRIKSPVGGDKHPGDFIFALLERANVRNIHQIVCHFIIIIIILM